MGRFLNWLKSASQQQSAGNKTEGEHNDNSSFSWAEIDQADSSIFDTGKLVAEKSKNKNPVSHNTPDLEGDSVSGEKTGFDPYNSGRFDTNSK